MGSQKDNSNQQQASKMGFTSFICLASLLFVGVAFGQPRSQPAGCFCSGTITQDAGGTHGERLTKWGGRYWCYVIPNSQCPDKQIWNEGAQRLYYSYVACSGLNQGRTCSC